MRYPIEDTAKRHGVLVQRASEMFRERGFDDVSVAEVMKAAGLTHGAFYSHFDSKTDLMRASVESAMEESRASVAKSYTSKKGKTAFIDRYLSVQHRDDTARGCPMSSLSGELRKEPELQEVFAKKFGEIVEATGETRDEAMFDIATMVGAMSLSRALGKDPLSNEILALVRKRMNSR